ncbi:MAG TPA: glycosyltransferase family 2 protein [Candidatus Caccomorpha excrementavium]|nr:glycosyltransferase family 2 protein [Candidatus Caccomorpha excrementavium]
MSTVNIVMATYQGERFLGEQIESILHSGYTDWCLYIADDGSTDRTVEIAKSFEKRYPERIHVHVNSRNRGCTLNFLSALKRTANRAGESACSSNVPGYYMFCDQDDVWMPDKIEQTLRYMKQMEKKYGKQAPAAVFTDARVVDEKLTQIYRSFYLVSRLDTRRLDLAHILMENKLIGCTMMMNDALVSMLTELPEYARYHDWWMALIAAAFGHIGYYPAVTLSYRQHGGNEVGTRKFSEYVKIRLGALKKQKEELLLTQKQAESFLEMYGQKLNEKNRRLIGNFAVLSKMNWAKRRWCMLRYRYYKTGIVRNIGVFLIL